MSSVRLEWEDLLDHRHPCVYGPVERWTERHGGELEERATGGCPRFAEALLDGEPVCLDCAELLLDRLEARAVYPELVNRLPGLEDRAL